MNHLGHIEIKDKVRFVYYEIEKPDSTIYEQTKDFYFDCAYYKEVIKAYEASKREVIVENVFWWNEFKVWTFTSRSYKEFDGKKVINKQPCEAEITDGKALITKIIT